MDRKMQEYIGIAALLIIAILLGIFGYNYEPTPKLTSKQVERLNVVIADVKTIYASII